MIAIKARDVDNLDIGRCWVRWSAARRFAWDLRVTGAGGIARSYA
jgi:hypothetical protein